MKAAMHFPPIIKKKKNLYIYIFITAILRITIYVKRINIRYINSPTYPERSMSLCTSPEEKLNFLDVVLSINSNTGMA